MPTVTEARALSSRLRSLAGLPGIQLAWQETIMEAASLLDAAADGPLMEEAPAEPVVEAVDEDDGKLPEPVNAVEEASGGMVAKADTAGNRKKKR